jgi:hypothetical protein
MACICLTFITNFVKIFQLLPRLYICSEHQSYIYSCYVHHAKYNYKISMLSAYINVFVSTLKLLDQLTDFHTVVIYVMPLHATPVEVKFVQSTP